MYIGVTLCMRRKGSCTFLLQSGWVMLSYILWTLLCAGVLGMTVALGGPFLESWWVKGKTTRRRVLLVDGGCTLPAGPSNLYAEAVARQPDRCLVFSE